MIVSAYTLLAVVWAEAFLQVLKSNPRAVLLSSWLPFFLPLVRLVFGVQIVTARGHSRGDLNTSRLSWRVALHLVGFSRSVW